MNLTYIIGAGASYNSLPLATEIPSRLKLMASYTRYLKRANVINHAYTDEFIKKVAELVNEVKGRTTIDVYASELANSNSPKKLAELKTILSCLFYYEQLPKDNAQFRLDEISANGGGVADMERVLMDTDKRYFDFIQKFTKDRKLKSGVNLISWNYDIQFELANRQGGSLELSMDHLNIYPPIKGLYQKGMPSLVKLNGTAGIMYTGKEMRNYFPPSDMDDVKEIMHYLIESVQTATRPSRLVESLKFSFENQHGYNPIETAKKILMNTEVLVVIGYSFGSGNWKIDMEYLKDANNLNKVYVQVPKTDWEDKIKDNLRAVLPNWADKCIVKPDLESFFIPPEAVNIVTS